MKEFNVYFLGNDLIEEDSLPLRLIPELKKDLKNLNFLELDPTEGLPDEENLIIIDSIINTKNIIIFSEKDIDKFEKSPNYSAHDFDLSMSLKIAKKLGKLKKIKIIGVPSGMQEEIALKEIKDILKNINKN